MKKRDLYEPWGDADCECGRPKLPGHVSCVRCRWLDNGGGSGGALMTEIVSQLRLHRELTASELSELTGSAPRAVLLAVQLLMGRGRLARREIDVPGHAWSTVARREVITYRAAWIYRLIS